MAEGGGILNPELKINLTAIKKCDKFVVNILDNASQVALYKFKSDTQAWEKTEVEGALFVYSRSMHPRTSFFIMNRLKMENLTEPITAEMEFKLQEPFLLYRNKARDIFGIWFYDRGECSRLGQLMTRLSTGVEELKASTTRQTATTTTKEKQLTAPSNGKVNLLQLFAKAQEKYDKANVTTPEESAPTEEVKPIQVKRQQQVDEQPQSVPSPDPSSTKPRAQTLPAQYWVSPNRQRLLSGTEKCDPGQRQPSPVTSVQDSADSSRNVTLASVRVPVITAENQPQGDSPKPIAQRKLFQSSITAASPSSQESPQKQVDSASGSGTSLMSPLAFQSSARTSASTPGGTTSVATKPSIAPLQMEQFVQAFAYLVKNDGDFMQRLHEAYVKTLQGN